MLTRPAQRLGLVGLTVLLALACAACGGASPSAKRSVRHTGSDALPSPLMQQIRAQIRKPSVVMGSSSVKTVQVYGPASHAAIEKAVQGKAFTGDASHGRGRWYLIVLHGHFVFTGPLPPGAKQPRSRVVMEVWSPTAKWGSDVSFESRLPAAVSRLGRPAAIDLS